MIRLLEGNAKCRHLKKMTYKGTLRQVFICLKPKTLYPPHTYLYAVYLFTHGRGGGGLCTKEKARREGLQFTKLGRKDQHD